MTCITHISPNSLYISLIRHPLGSLKSIQGTSTQQKAVTEQWQRLKDYVTDPLPDAENYFTESIADCARAYITLYRHLQNFQPQYGIRISYEEMTTNKNWTSKLNIHPKFQALGIADTPLIGSSSKTSFDERQENYIEKYISPIYYDFLTEY